MDQLTKTAKHLNTLFRVLRIAISIGIVSALVGLAIIGAGFLFGLDPYTIGNGYSSISIGPLELEIAQDYAPDEHLVLLVVAAELVFALICLLILRPCIDCVRDIFRPMTEGQPFHASISANLKKLAKRSILLCILSNLFESIPLFLWCLSFDLPGLLISEKITRIGINADLDLTFLIVAAIVYLLSCIFHYGEQLQQLSDETL